MVASDLKVKRNMLMTNVEIKLLLSTGTVSVKR